MHQCQQLDFSQLRRLVRKLAAYASAVSGTSLLAISGEADAAIFYTDLGPTGVTVSQDTFDIDLDGDSHVDYVLQHFGNSFHGSGDNFSLFAVAVHGEDVAIESFDHNFVAAIFPYGDIIDEGHSSFYRKGILNYIYSNRGCDSTTCTSRFYSSGNFGRGFLGLRFEHLAGGKNMAWIEVSVLSVRGGFQVLGYAYESEPGKPITAGAVPEPPSLLLMAAGASGLAALRRRRYQAI